MERNQERCRQIHTCSVVIRLCRNFADFSRLFFYYVTYQYQTLTVVTHCRRLPIRTLPNVSSFFCPGNELFDEIVAGNGSLLWNSLVMFCPYDWRIVERIGFVTRKEAKFSLRPVAANGRRDSFSPFYNIGELRFQERRRTWRKQFSDTSDSTTSFPTLPLSSDFLCYLLISMFDSDD